MCEDNEWDEKKKKKKIFIVTYIIQSTPRNAKSQITYWSVGAPFQPACYLCIHTIHQTIKTGITWYREGAVLISMVGSISVAYSFVTTELVPGISSRIEESARTLVVRDVDG